MASHPQLRAIRPQLIRRVSLILIAALALVVPAALAASKPKTKRVDVSSSGAQATGGPSFAQTGEAISANGRFIAFASDATNLVHHDTNGAEDVFVRDLTTHKTMRVSVSSSGKQANGDSFAPSISADGRFVAFDSDATNLVHGDTNGHTDVFVHDLKTGKTTRVSVSSSGGQANGTSFNPSIDADGGAVAFGSDASDLVNGDTNNVEDIFVRNLTTHKTIRVSAGSLGQANDESSEPSIAANGSAVAFASFASNLVAGDTNGADDVFVRNLTTQKTIMVSVSSLGGQGNETSFTPSISANGRFVVFGSDADNLVANDTNNSADVFIRDLQKLKTRLVSLSSTGQQGNGSSFLVDPAVSSSGRFVAFFSAATNLVSHDTNGFEDVFVRDLSSQKTIRVSVSSSGKQAKNGDSTDASITSDGSFVAFASSATNLVGNDTNNSADVFLRGPLG